jgi:hypothetical protein
MNMKEKYYLQSIQSILELRDNGFLELCSMTSKLSNQTLVNKIYNEYALLNYGKIISLIDEELYKNYSDCQLHEIDDIKRFDFSYLIDIDISTIKNSIDVYAFNFKTALDKFGRNTYNDRHWDSQNRFSVLIDKELNEKVKLNPKLKLNITKEIILANQGYYTRFTITEHIARAVSKNFDNHESYDRDNWLKDASGSNDSETMNDVYWNLD